MTTKHIKTLLRAKMALSGRPIRLVVSDGAYAVIVAGEPIGCGFEFHRALSTFYSVADQRVGAL